ncbi:ERC protein 2-like isoform X2 [Sceloporus undulatus]|uniref:ERC protein 2-like isoform X2 n=1 Tax=Sceloporus undulatus TaxID=8520 RepID=UPI001C4BAEB5|nr:ERC protein 2-like isoform X2 [Sceloporus undulatus]
MYFSVGENEISPDQKRKPPAGMERRSKPEMECASKETESFSGSEKSSEKDRTLKMESLLKKVLVENQKLKNAVVFLKQQNKGKDNNTEDCRRAKEKLLTEIGSLLTEIAFLKEVREQLRYKDPESKKETTKALTETIQAKLEVAQAKIEAAEAKKETLEAQKKAEEAKESAEAAQAREDNLLSYVSKIATLAYQQAAEAEYDCAQARKAMAVAEAIQVAALSDGKARRGHKHHRSHRNHGECRCHQHHHHHHHHSHQESQSHCETQSDLVHSEPETLSSTR